MGTMNIGSMDQQNDVQMAEVEDIVVERSVS